jgi:ribonuclease HI
MLGNQLFAAVTQGLTCRPHHIAALLPEGILESPTVETPTSYVSPMTDESQVVEIYTDGACSGNPGPGGWGAVLSYGRHERELSGGESLETTNNRMELTAPIQALRTLTRPCVVRIYTDSAYVRDGITKWLPRWKDNDWRTSTNEPVKNADLWEQLESAMEPHEVNWHWVKGHAGIAGNERADRLAADGLRRVLLESAVAPSRSSNRSPVSTGADADQTDTEATVCVHDMPLAWCALCKAPPASVLPYGYRTGEGNAYHNDRHCNWLHRGQRRAERQGKNTHEVVRIAWNAADPGELQPCEFCCTREWMKRHGHVL